MSCKYKFWDGEESIITPSGVTFTAEQWKNQNPWYGVNGAKMVISNSPINGGRYSEFESFVNNYKSQGLVLKYGMTDEEVLQAISDFEDNRDSVCSDVVSNQRKLNTIFAEYLIDINNANAKVIASLQAMYNTNEDDVPFNN